MVSRRYNQAWNNDRKNNYILSNNQKCGNIYNSIKSMLGNHLYIGQAGNARNVVLEMLHCILEMLHSSISVRILQV
jgi:hypothetical protein